MSRNPWNVPGPVRICLREMDYEGWAINSVRREHGDVFTIIASLEEDDGYWEGTVWIPCITRLRQTLVVKCNNRQSAVAVISCRTAEW